MNLHTDRLRIREIGEGDLPAVRRWLSDEGFCRFGPGWTADDAPAYLERCLRRRADEGSRPGLVELLSTGDAIGSVGLLWQEVGGERELEVAYRLVGAHHGRGYATEAARAVCDHGFDAFEVDRLVSIVAVDNGPSRRVAEKNGMRALGEVVFHGWRASLFAISREEWAGGSRGSSAATSSPPPDA